MSDLNGTMKLFVWSGINKMSMFVILKTFIAGKQSRNNQNLTLSKAEK